MDADEYRRMAELQDRHWWFAAKRRVVGEILARHHFGGGTSPVLEVGCGTGAMVPVMARWGRPVGTDLHLPALRHIDGVARVGADLADLPFGDGTFGLVGCFDVLYHRCVVDVDAALRELFRVCAAGGDLMITDSAFPILRSSHDVATHGARRFRLPGLSRRLRAAGFEVVHGTYFHTKLFPIAAAVRLGKRALWGTPPREDQRPGPVDHEPDGRRAAGVRSETSNGGDRHPGTLADRVPARSDLRPAPGWLNGLLGVLYTVEAALAARMRLPLGLSLAILARRPVA